MKKLTSRLMGVIERSIPGLRKFQQRNERRAFDLEEI